MADGRVEIQVGLNNSGIRQEVEQTNRELSRVGSNMGQTAREMRNTFGGEFAGMNRDIMRGHTQVSASHMAMLTEMKNYNKQHKASLQVVREKQIEAQYGYFQMSQSMGTYTGSVSDMINQANSYGKAMKTANDQAINSNKMANMSLLQTIGTMNNMTSIATRTANNLAVMNNPLYNTSRLALAGVSALDRLASSGSPQQLALEFLGANASVKQYNDFIRDLNTKMMHMPIVFGLATAGATKFYGALHGKVMEENTQYAEAFNNMMEKLSKVFEPMRQAFASMMIPIYKFITAIAELIIKFNEAHPVLAKFIQGMMMLVPALMVILTPLALGIGYFAGLRAILFALKPILIPIATMFASMSAPAWILAGAITGLVMVFTHFYRSSETFRNAINNMITSIKNFTISVGQGIGNAIKMAIPHVVSFGQNIASLGKYLFWTAVDGDHLNDWITHLPAPFQATALAVGQSVSIMRGHIVSAFAPIMQLGQHIVSLGKYLFWCAVDGDQFNDWLSHLPLGFQNVALAIGTAVSGIREKIAEMVNIFKLALGGDTSAIGQIFTTIIPTLIGMLVGGLPALLLTATRFLPTIVDGINTNLPMITTTITNIITGMVDIITTYLPRFLEQGIAILTKVIEGLVQILPQVITTLINCATSMIDSFITIISTLLPVVIDAGIKILMAVIDGIVKSLPKIIESALKVIDTYINAMMKLLPQILDAGVKILMAVIDGIIKVLPKLIDCAINLITKICDAIIQNLPKILDAGIKILMALIDGIIKILPKLIDCAIKLVMKVAEMIIQNLPKIIDAGMKILMALIDGIIKILPKLISTGLKLVFEIAKAIIQNLPQILQAGVQILGMLIKGILSMVGQLLSMITREVVNGITNCFKGAGKWLLQAGKDIVNGLKNGISSMAKDAVQSAKNIGSDIKNAVTGFFKIHSPSRLMFGLGEFVTEGLANGIEYMSGYAVSKAESMTNAVLGAFDGLGEDMQLGDVVAGNIPNLASLTSGSIKLAPSERQAITTGTSKTAPVKSQTTDEGSDGTATAMNIYLDRNLVGEAVAEPVDNANKRKSSRMAMFKPTVVPQ